MMIIGIHYMGGRTEADHRVPVPGLASLGILVLENHPLDTDSGLREHRQTSGLVPDNKIVYSKKNKVQENQTAVLKLFEGFCLCASSAKAQWWLYVTVKLQRKT